MAVSRRFDLMGAVRAVRRVKVRAAAAIMNERQSSRRMKVRWKWNGRG